MTAPERGLLLVMHEIPPQHEDEFNRWYWEEHLPERRDLDGFLSARRFVAVEGAPKYLALYDLENPDVLHSEAYQRVNATTPWTAHVRTLRTDFRRNVYRELPPPS